MNVNGGADMESRHQPVFYTQWLSMANIYQKYLQQTGNQSHSHSYLEVFESNGLGLIFGTEN